MNRSVTNTIRWCMDELLPAFIRDAWVFMWPLYCIAYKTMRPSRYMNFKSEVLTMSPDQYSDFYNNLDSISRNRKTDNSAACINRIVKDCSGAASILDVGCGRGYLLEKINAKYPSAILTGVDLLAEAPSHNFKYIKSSADSLPFADKEFDIVCCTHVIEHVIDPQIVINELLRVTRKTVIVVTPKQRPFYYTLDEHINFFFYSDKLKRLARRATCTIENVSGDWYMVIEK